MPKTQYPTDYLKKEGVNSEVAEPIEEQHIEQVTKALKQASNKEDNKGLKRPIEDLFSDQEFLLSQKKKHKRLKSSPDNQLSVPKFNQEQDAWQISVPRNSNCLFLAAVLSYLIPVKDNPNDFRERRNH